MRAHADEREVKELLGRFASHRFGGAIRHLVSRASPPREMVAAQLRRGDVTSTELTMVYLERIQRFDRQMLSYITTTADEALERARAADETFERYGPTGPLHGLPMAVKDNIDTAGTTTTVGSRFFAQRVPHYNAAVVVRLLEAGALLLGKTALHEFAFGATTQNPHYGCCRNPWDLRRIPGGSSGGSAAAVAGDLCAAALGTDAGGSVRVPAALNGLTGLRPTSGCVSTAGVFPVSWTLDTVGPMARSASDVADVFGAVAGFDPADPHSVPVAQPLRAAPPNPAAVTIGIPREFFFEDVDPEVRAAVRDGVEMLSQMGAYPQEIDIPGAPRAVEIAWGIASAEALALHRRRLEEKPAEFGDDVRARLCSGRRVSGADYAAMREEARVWRSQVRTLFDQVDVILTPATPIVAPLAEDADMVETTRQLTRFTYGWSLAGVPALTLPCGFSSDRMPIGMQLAAAPWSEATLLAVGKLFQEETRWHKQEAPLDAMTTEAIER